ncbi:MAG TPA: glycosyltransferase family 4 protein [Chitinophagaceae bacterium]|jgi:glycosyltransferase involved in cell wall biosynthesis|nr:glycosyltransferase family 4 protein [Chitinophagaceae bacterium]
METGGAQILVVDLMNEMCNEHDVALIIVNRHNEALLKKIDKRVKIYYINRAEGSKNPVPILRLNLLLLRLNPSVIHCHEPKMAGVIKFRRAKLVYTIHDIGIPLTYYEQYDSLVAISDAVFNDVRERCSLPMVTVYNGIPANRFQKRKTYSEETGSFRLVQVSRLMHEKKGQDILLYALNKVVYELGYSNVCLDFIGEGSSMQLLKDLALKLNLSDHVNFMGNTDREWIFSNLCDYHVLVQPSRYEGFGLTILEGFAAGIPVLASDIEGPAEIMSQSPGGFLFKNGDSSDCARRLQFIFGLYQNREIIRLMNATTPVMEKKYSIKSCSKEYLDEYARLLN